MTISLALLVGLATWAFTTVSRPLLQTVPLPTLASTASVGLYQAQISPTGTAVSTATNTPTPTYTPIPTHTPTSTQPPPTPTATATQPTATATMSPPTATPTTIGVYPDLALVPQQPQSYLEQFRLVAYYGSPTGVGLGILGNQSRPATLSFLRQTVSVWAPYFDKPVIATYHMVTTVANPHPPEFRHQVALDLIQEWVDAAKAERVAVILDIQPGRADIMTEYHRVRHLLYEPHVHLALDPEFVMVEGQFPLVQVGQLYANQINQIQADMNEIGYEIGLNRVLILHQFKDSMLPDKANIQAYDYVELVIDGDGVGPAAAKIRNYNQYAAEAGFEYGGFKLFPRNGDYPVMSPEWVMEALTPQPVIIIIQ